MSFCEPKKDCKHIPEKIFDKFPNSIRYLGCKECGVRGENWFCLHCGIVLCGRFRNSHMLEHYEQTKHTVVVSFADLSFWCYNDSTYILHKNLTPLYEHLHNDKFGHYPPKSIEEGQKLEEMLRKENPSQFIDTTEYFDDEELLEKKVKECAMMMKESKYTVIYSGAGISTSADIPDYRGPQGIWTLQERGEGLENLKEVHLEKTNPTYSHMAISFMMKKGVIHYVVSTNVDGLHIKSGIPLDKIAEVHGNVFKEKCTKCQKQFHREFDTTKSVMKSLDEKNHKNHLTMRQCEECQGDLKDTIIHFTEPLDQFEIGKSIEVSRKAEVCLILGTSMRVSPANEFPFMNERSKTILVNLQKTPVDKNITVKVYCKIDKFMKMLLEEMGFGQFSGKI